ncbi:hypothetical protein N7532_007690 [Penicillium argentinense]|uniref:Uncharacterized protein n=1 Tax=Penicillium argentinense TaxID=1131581 RepID=A0A9W9EW75_9EURO|nr:uncharacterized protein N7532_007690 [Penicillium argentinense]KAJ5089006.1 hypothetical protein N7532_007690 [Penicillium argentinense]
MNPNSTSFGQPVLPDSYAPARTAAQTGNISPPESCHVNEDEKDKQAPPRHPLPCIREVLGNNLPLPYPMQILLPRIQSAHTAPSSHQIGRPSSGRMPTEPINLIRPVTWSPMWDNGFPHQSQVQEEASRTDFTSITTEESENMSLDSLRTGKSPIQSAKTDIVPRPRVTKSLRARQRSSESPSHCSNSVFQKKYPETAQRGLIFDEKSVTCVWPLPYNKGKVQWGEP